MVQIGSRTGVGIIAYTIDENHNSLSDVPSYLRTKPTASLEETLAYYKMQKDFLNSATQRKRTTSTTVDIGDNVVADIKLNQNGYFRSEEDSKLKNAFNKEETRPTKIWRSFANIMKSLPMQYVLNSMVKTYSANLITEPHYQEAAETFRACPILRPVVKHLQKDTICYFLSFVVDFFSSAPPALMGILNIYRNPTVYQHDGNAMKLPYQYNCNFPEKKIPYFISKEIAEQEKSSFYWYYSTLLNFWSYVGQCRIAKYPDNNPYPPAYEFGNNNYYNLAIVSDQYLPLAAALYNEEEEHMVLLIRGSALKVDWDMNFDYKLASEEFTRDVGKVEGRAHNGFLTKAIEIRNDIDQLIYAKKPKRVSICGQSLGGAIANILGFYIAKNHYPSDMAQVEVLAIGSPQVGDYAFQQGLKRYVNVRNLVFSGTEENANPFHEIMDMHFEVGDFVTQIPFPCVDSPNCPLVTEVNGVGSSDDYFQYYTNQGVVILRPEDLRNPSSWQREANWILDTSVGEPGMETCHMCSYMCWMAEGSIDDGSLCYTNRDVEENAPGYVPGMHICDV